MHVRDIVGDDLVGNRISFLYNASEREGINGVLIGATQRQIEVWVDDEISSRQFNKSNIYGQSAYVYSEQGDK